MSTNSTCQIMQEDGSVSRRHPAELVLRFTPAAQKAMLSHPHNPIGEIRETLLQSGKLRVQMIAQLMSTLCTKEVMTQLQNIVNLAMFASPSDRRDVFACLTDEEMLNLTKCALSNVQWRRWRCQRAQPNFPLAIVERAPLALELPNQSSEAHLRTLDNMERMGGGFVSALAFAWRKADASNHARLYSQFADYYWQYAPKEDRAKEGQQP